MSIRAMQVVSGIVVTTQVISGIIVIVLCR